MPRDAMTPRELTRRPLGDQIADQLRQEILLGRLSPGAPLSQETICELYGTSRMPARDAVARLMHEGLVISTPGGHAVVAAMTRADVIDAFDLNALAHGRAGRRAAQHATEQDVDELQRLHDQMVEKSGSTDALENLNWQFHRMINRLSKSAKLMAMVRGTAIDIPRSYLSELPDFTPKVNQEHAEIVRALRDRDEDTVERLLRSHLESAGRHLADYLERQGRFTEADDEVTARPAQRGRRTFG